MSPFLKSKWETSRDVVRIRKRHVGKGEEYEKRLLRLVGGLKVSDRGVESLPWWSETNVRKKDKTSDFSKSDDTLPCE